MLINQLKIDFSAAHSLVENEKKTELISFRAGEKFKTDLQAIATAKKIDLSSLIYEYAIKGFIEDYKNILLLQLNGEKTIQELLR